MSGWVSNSARTPSRTTKWSSTITTVTLLDIEFSTFLYSVDMTPGSHPNTIRLGGLKLEPSARQSFGAFAHVSQSHSAACPARIEAYAVIRDRERGVFLINADLDHGASRVAVAGDVGKRFLHDAEKGLLDRTRQSRQSRAIDLGCYSGLSRPI